DAALDWLGRALHDPPGDRSPAERPAHQAASSGPTDEASQPGPAHDEPTPRPQSAPAPHGPPREPPRLVRGRPRSPSTHGRPATVSRPRPTPAPSPSPPLGLALEQVHALTEQQQRILHRSVVLEWALKAETLDPLTMREAFADLLLDIITSARTI